MLYLKYRPKIIEELDNGQVKEKITSILKSKNVPHAFLFTGQKGTGKTSTARIIAKSLNCLKNLESVEPCNKCSNCLSIESSSSPDVVEQDAASNRGIDEVRSLIKESAFSPMTSRYRVFIIDEAHMITNDAFNALLKTLEEPPPSVIFILATTNEEKVPKTIRSRCLHLQFGTAKEEDILRMLKRITAAEKVTIPDDVLDIISKRSDKSFRDAAKLLEELITQDKLTSTEALLYLGIRSGENLISIIQSRPLKDALRWIDDFSQSGASMKSLIEDLLQELRLVLLGKGEISTLRVAEVAYLMKLLSEAYQNLRLSPIESIPLEIAIVEFYNYKNSK